MCDQCFFLRGPVASSSNSLLKQTNSSRGISQNALGERQQLQIAFNGAQLHFLMLKKTHTNEEIPVAFMINFKSGHKNKLASDISEQSRGYYYYYNSILLSVLHDKWERLLNLCKPD